MYLLGWGIRWWLSTEWYGDELGSFMPSGVFRYCSPAYYHFAYSESHFEGVCVFRGGVWWGTHTF